ncbi:putative aryl-alcohol dehydrogenase AAD14 [Fusarium oxysporum f. sp. cubense]|uniref:Putative aryl-alcohol dehydrogenase AAD14 n=1 Tax=Fusarium oxysporum f. sp. cubense TaxID=61366 RepID=A0A559LF22_FUSOC|nr:putative aryl-alcohol dehydrogenase AAD14 [Fusarium oxysporum f. sp. cubense]
MSLVDFFNARPEPATPLGRYRVLSSSAGARVSPLCLGGMSFGTTMAAAMGGVDEEQSFKILDAYADAGGNFIDTANDYQGGQSETYIGNWMAARNNRDSVFIATKFTNNYRFDIGPDKRVNYSGNHKKSLFLSLDASLLKLQTGYIDLLYVHWWDWTTSIEELMDSLHLLIQQGKVLYLGVSDTPAWVVSAANTYARDHGKTPFSVYQGRWNVMIRDFERDIIPMAHHFGMAIVPWDALGGGKLQTEKQIEAGKMANEGLRPMWGPGQTEVEKKTSKTLEEVSEQVGATSIQQVALAYLIHKARNVFPLIGGRKVEHLHDNIKGLEIQLTDKHIQIIEAVQPFDIGFPVSMVGENPRDTGITPLLLRPVAPFSWQVLGKTIVKG